MDLFLNIFIGGLLIGGIYSLVSMGLSLQYGVGKVYNIAHGEFLMFGAFITYWLQSMGVNPLVAVVINAPLMFIVGFILYRTVFTGIRVRSPNPGVFESNGMLAAFGLYFIVQNIAVLIWGSTPYSYQYLNTSVALGPSDFHLNRIIAAVFAIAIGVIFYIFLVILYRTKIVLRFFQRNGRQVSPYFFAYILDIFQILLFPLLFFSS